MTRTPVLAHSVKNKDGIAVLGHPYLHLVTDIKRDANGDLIGLTEQFGVLKIEDYPARPGTIIIEIPRNLVIGMQEFTFTYGSSEAIVRPIIQKKGAMILFKVDSTTKEIDIGKIVIELSPAYPK